MPASLEPFALPERYRLQHGIAAGGMAAVYAAHDTVLDRPVAVKVLADHLNDDPVARGRFEREARAAAALSSHPGVVTIFDVGEHGGRAFLVMERRNGGTIGDVGPVSRERALAWLRTVADALDAAHAAGVVHRDIKPGNLLLDERDKVAVADFGIASLAHDTERFTQTGQVLGTASYLSPEQATGEVATAASDRYALAVVAYELLTGAKPFVGEHFAAQARAHIEDTPPAAVGLPPAAQRVLARGLAKDPRDRWPSAIAFVDALGSAFAQTEPTVPLPVRPAGGNSLRGAWIALGLIALLLGGGLVALIAGMSTPGPVHHARHRAAAHATAKPTAAAVAPNATAVGGTSPASLNAAGFAREQAGDYAGAVGILERAVSACGDHGPLDPCGYATYNLGVAMDRSGRSADAARILEARLRLWGDNPAHDVQRELDRAQGRGAGPAPAKAGKPPRPGHGHAFGHRK